MISQLNAPADLSQEYEPKVLTG